ncbi:FtsX-like permease family protein [Streptomyces sp. NPDC048496]|uniref:FtsX-like permease family protein n=1 Tax=Streptomyces sp. NPDC048496 TaxID=3365558 RepID=UPI003716916E
MLRDLGLGIRFAVSGGREGWTRTLLTAVGVGLGVALLLVAASAPHLLDERSARDQARAETKISESPDVTAKKSDTSVLRISAETEYRGRSIGGFLMRADGAHPVVPPGVAGFPAADEMVVSPALKELLGSSEGSLLKERLPYRITDTIADAGLVSPGELLFYVGSDTLTPANGGHRIAGYGNPGPAEEMPPILIVLIIMICVVLLVPVAIFIATAVRFGGDRRMATAGAIDPSTLPHAQTKAQIRVDESVKDVAEYVRNTAARLDPGMRVVTLKSVARDRQYASVQTGLQVGATATLLLIAAAMLVSQLEQLRERKRLLSVLVAFGTRRSTLGWSVLWQTAVPVVIGLVVAVAGGLGLGAAMIWMVAKKVTDWWLFLPMTGAGAALILLVTLVSLPSLWRLMRPDGLRTE